MLYNIINPKLININRINTIYKYDYKIWFLNTEKPILIFDMIFSEAYVTFSKSTFPIDSSDLNTELK